ncbi:hypothetical protein LAV73_22770 [Lysinibacillus xylanilyticus]|uniref:CatA-like O-acetyltransferase n=1 Tax=Lysinibacillus xylanilyticus TaxID=582475 RepID=UPI002B24AB38|nr:CatA-like O-acetyltransferase [Lysinibacillus xylanilyticus]MEB2282749.1 hypothetical protein [Lysinibacillus xylanilyticus]
MICNKINRKNWYRDEYFEHYITPQTTFSMTSEIDIRILYKNIKNNNFKFYPIEYFSLASFVESVPAYYGNAF